MLVVLFMSGGTILKSARSKDFFTKEGQEAAYNNMVKHGIDALVVIGGNGSLTGAMNFAREYDVCCIGLLVQSIMTCMELIQQLVTIQL